MSAPPLDLSDLPKRLLDDPISRAWATEYRSRELRGETLCLWRPDQVDERIVEAVRLAHQVAGPIGPKVFGRGWPEVVRAFDHLAVGNAELDVDSLPADPADARPRAPRYTARQVSQMEAALWWPAVYLKGQRGPLNVYNCWLRCKAYRKHFRKAVTKMGWNEATARRRRWQAAMIIATGLIRDGVEAPPQKEEIPRD